MELFKVVTVEEAKSLIKENFHRQIIETENVNILKSYNRVLAQDIYSECRLPHFNRSTVDGYAVICDDTYGASESIPAILDIVGEVEMGNDAGLEIKQGQCAYVPTGGMIPSGTDAVVMIEYTEDYGDNSIGVNKSVGNLENTIMIGSDIELGELILKKGTKIEPSHIGALASIGIEEVPVFRKPRVSIISTGDEIIHPSKKPLPGQIRDINTYTLSSMAEILGCEIVKSRVVEDNYDELFSTINEAIEYSDIVLISGGSSVGTKDYTANIINKCGNPGVLTHGLAIKPGKPTILGRVDNKAVIGMPGQPVSAMVVFNVLIKYLIEIIVGKEGTIDTHVEGVMTQNIASAGGKETYQMVELIREDGQISVKPLYGKSGMISLISRSYGYIKIDSNKEGMKKGEKVSVYKI